MSGHVRVAYQTLAVTISRPPLGAIYSLLSLAASTAYAGAMTSDTLRCDTCSWHSAQLRPAADLGHQAEMIIREERADHQTREEPTIIRGKSRPTTEGRTDHQTREEPTIKRGKSRASNEGRIERRTGNNPVSNEGRAERRTREEPSVERGKSRPSKESGVDSHRVIETAVHNAATSRATDHRKHTRGCKKVK